MGITSLLEECFEFNALPHEEKARVYIEAGKPDYALGCYKKADKWRKKKVFMRIK